MTFEEMLHRFQKVCKENGEYGADDGEPMMILRGLLRKAMAGEGVSVPENAAGWSLYKKEGADIVGSRLGAEAWPMVMLARSSSALFRFAK